MHDISMVDKKQRWNAPFLQRDRRSVLLNEKIEKKKQKKRTETEQRV